MKIIIVDDEKKGIDNLTALLTKYCKNIEILASSQTIEGGIKIIEEYKPQLVFLDIEIGNRKSFEILEHLSYTDFELIFVTAYNQYMLKAFKYSAMDYILKPINVLELIEAVERIGKRIDKTNKTGSLELLKSLSDDESKNNLSKKIAVPIQNGHKLLEIANISRCESDNYYTWIFISTGEKYLVTKTLKFYDQLLEVHGFLRVHQSHLINPTFITEIKKNDGSCNIIMKDLSYSPVSRQKRKTVEELKGNFK